MTDQGGDPACWADRVCPACGMLDERPRRDGRCPHCGTTAEADPTASPPPPTGAGDRPDDGARPDADPPAGR